jgi:oligopeptide/dipeptide ABC transporter ATP-binding protein
VTPLLEVTDLTKTFRARGLRRHREAVHAVDHATFSLAPGETLAIVGESGAGKSTVGRLVLRLEEPDSGSIKFEGRDLRELSRGELQQWRRRAQMVFQDPFGSFDPKMSIEQSLVEPLVIHDSLPRGRRREVAIELLERVGLEESVLDRYPYEFSGGQLQRLAIARAIATKPALLVCDEPTAALDMSIQAQVLNLLGRLQTELGIAMLFISHNLSLVRAFADRVAVMYGGRIVEMGPARQVYEHPAHPYTRALLSAVPVPNPTLQRRRAAIPLPDTALVLEGGCPFANRCPEVMDICRTVQPPLTVRAAGVVAACHLSVEMAAPPETAQPATR